jgi:lipid II:glycine glycyltransferase (peptidoglycan interpeptide bridge formation enzyme)
LHALRELNVVSAFARLHPAISNNWLLSNIAKIVDHGPTIWIDLSLSDEEYHAQLSKRDRRNILRAQKDFESVVDTSCENLDAFIAMYYETMTRAQATPDYFYSREYFHELVKGMENSAALLFMRDQGELIAGSMVFSAGDFLQVHLRATPTQFLKMDGSQGLIEVIRRWGKARGNKWLSLGGGVGLRRDKLFEFKARFSPVQLTYQSARIIVDQVIYDELSDAHRRSSAVNSHQFEESFFPTYRAPIVPPCLTTDAKVDSEIAKV